MHDHTRAARLFIFLALSIATPAITALAGQTPLLHRGAVWRYLDDGSDQGTAWRATGFDDSGWSAGAAQLGYGDGDEATVVGFGPNPSAKFITTYFRTVVDIADPAQFATMTAKLVRDDGAVVYVNGVEAGRSNMPVGAIDYLTRASGTVGGTDEIVFFDLALNPLLFTSGANVIAVEIHQRAGTSSDTSFDFELLGGNGGPIITRGPYLQLATQDSIIIRWRTDQPTDSVVNYGPAPGDLPMQVSDAVAGTLHELRVSGLAADTRYSYSVGSSAETLAGDDEYHHFRTAPLLGTSTPTRVWAIGDSGTADADAAAVRNAFKNFTGARGADVWLMLGDNAYNSGRGREYQAAVFGTYPALLRTSVAWPTIGNHDAISADSPSESGPYYTVFTLPRAGEAGGLASGTEAYYSFDHGNIHFISLDSQDTNRSPTGAMMTWLENDLASTLQEWIIAYWHHPPYTRGSHNSDNDGDSSGRMRDMREIALPILEAGGVDLVLTGHSHSYERTFLLDGHYGRSPTLQPEMILDPGDGRPSGDGAYAKPSAGPAPHEGAVYIVAGSSGQTSGGLLNHPAMFVSFSELGSVVLDIDGLRLDAVFLDSAGGIRDSFRIVKGDPPCPGDLDHDGAVGLGDLAILLSHFGTRSGASAAHGDLDADGDIDLADLGGLLSRFGSKCP